MRFCLNANETRVIGERGRHECCARQAIGIWGEGEEAGGRSEREVEMLPGASHNRHYMRGGGEKGERRGGKRIGGTFEFVS